MQKDLDSEPLVSVIVPVHNKRPHLERSINSVLSQELLDFELCLVDDASTDGSDQVLKAYSESDSRIRLFRRDKPGPGGYAGRNFGIAQAKGRWIAFLDADDEWAPHHLTRLPTLDAEFPDIDLISCGWDIFSPDSVKMPSPFTARFAGSGDRRFTLQDYISGPRPIWMGVAIVRASAFDKVGSFDKRWKHGADLEMWLRLLCEMDGNAIWLDQISATYFRDSINMVTANLQQTKSPSAVYIHEMLNRDNDIAPERRARLRSFANKVAFKPYLRGVASGASKDSAADERFFNSDLDWRIRAVLRLIRVLPANGAAMLARRLLDRYES